MAASTRLAGDLITASNIQFATSAASGYYFMPTFTAGGLMDPLAAVGVKQQMPPETPEQWLRRRVREVSWGPS